MLRKSHRLLFFPGMNNNPPPPGGSGNNTNNNFQNTLQQQMMMQNQQGGGGAGAGGFPGGGMMNPQALSQLREQMQRQMTPEMREQMKNQMMQNLGGKNGGKISLGMMGVGVNEKGKRVARGAKIDFDMATGKMSKDFHEKQLDADDPMLPKETVENYDTEDCIEINLDDDGKVVGEGDRKISGGVEQQQQQQYQEAETVTVKSKTTGSDGSLKEEEEVLEIVIEDTPQEGSTKKN